MTNNCQTTIMALGIIISHKVSTAHVTVRYEKFLEDNIRQRSSLYKPKVLKSGKDIINLRVLRKETTLSIQLRFLNDD
ncbi:unnamed protein product [Rhizophagus irregularis]|uniref:Uncharacterized protein n=1 Tax=Rhizophagus irregularis TaxID=588596 RepID=A0A915YZH2_9GLOM|nr:unnamed protein product [Rhizophagus irregularis]